VQVVKHALTIANTAQHEDEIPRFYCHQPIKEI